MVCDKFGPALNCDNCTIIAGQKLESQKYEDYRCNENSLRYCSSPALEDFHMLCLPSSRASTARDPPESREVPDHLRKYEVCPEAPRAPDLVSLQHLCVQRVILISLVEFYNTKQVNGAHFEQCSSGVIQHSAGFKSCYLIKRTLAAKSMPSTLMVITKMARIMKQCSTFSNWRAFLSSEISIISGRLNEGLGLGSVRVTLGSQLWNITSCSQCQQLQILFSGLQNKQKQQTYCYAMFRNSP